MLTKKRRGKPFYKQFLKIRKNIINSPKIFHFKREKWKKFIFYAKKQLKFFKRYKIRDQYRILISKFASRGKSFQKNFKKNLIERKIFNIFYGGLPKQYIKKHIKKYKNKPVKYDHYQTIEHQTLKFFESRIDSILHRAKFSLTIKGAKQLVLHGHILINGQTIRSKSYIVKTGDIIEIAHNVKSRELVKENIESSNFWPIPPKHLVINYNTGQIQVVFDKNLNFLSNLGHFLNINSLITNLKKFFFSSSEVEQVAVNHLDVGSNPA